MYGSIRGKVLRIDGFCALIEAGGMGYEVELPTKTLAALSEGQEAFLYLHHQVREDAELLFGFNELSERTVFRELLKVGGIGTRTALAVISTLTPEQLFGAVSAEDSKLISTVPGIGRKTAERLIVELKDRISKLQSVPGVGVSAADLKTQGAAAQAAGLAVDEAVSALIGLGYKESLAVEYVNAVLQEGMDTKQIIVAALSYIGNKNNKNTGRR